MLILNIDSEKYVFTSTGNKNGSDYHLEIKNWSELGLDVD